MSKVHRSNVSQNWASVRRRLSVSCSLLYQRVSRITIKTFHAAKQPRSNRMYVTVLGLKFIPVFLSTNQILPPRVPWWDIHCRTCDRYYLTSLEFSLQIQPRANKKALLFGLFTLCYNAVPILTLVLKKKSNIFLACCWLDCQLNYERHRSVLRLFIWKSVFNSVQSNFIFK